MMSYVFIGSNDVSTSEKFYEAVLFPLGYIKDVENEQLIFSLPDIPDRHNGPGAVFIAKPWNGEPALPGNGTMPGFRAPGRHIVEQIYRAGLLEGGTSEGQPGIRERYSRNFYVAYLRDPDGNKLAFFCTGKKD